MKLLLSANMTQALKIINDFGLKSNDPRRQMLYYLAILENQILCLDTDDHWYCKCNGSNEEEYLMYKLCLFRKQFRSLHEDAAQHYLKHEKEEFYEKNYWILALQIEILKQDQIVEEVLSKEYQYKNSYQGKKCNPKNIYRPWYLENLVEQKHLVVFNLFDKNNNYERFTYPL